MPQVPKLDHFPDRPHFDAPTEPLDWLWFKPWDKRDVVPGASLYYEYHPACARCDTYGVIDPKAERRQCWNCGRFIKGPSAPMPLVRKFYNWTGLGAGA